MIGGGGLEQERGFLGCGEYVRTSKKTQAHFRTAPLWTVGRLKLPQLPIDMTPNNNV